MHAIEAQKVLLGLDFTQQQQALAFGYNMPKGQCPQAFHFALVELDRVSKDAQLRVQLITGLKKKLDAIFPGNAMAQKKWIVEKHVVLGNRSVKVRMLSGDFAQFVQATTLLDRATTN